MRSGFVGQNAWTGSSRPARRRSGTWTGLKINGSNIHAHSPEDFNHLGLKDDAATSTVEIMGGALEDVDVPADLA